MNIAREELGIDEEPFGTPWIIGLGYDHLGVRQFTHKGGTGVDPEIRFPHMAFAKWRFGSRRIRKSLSLRCQAVRVTAGESCNQSGFASSMTKHGYDGMRTKS